MSRDLFVASASNAEVLDLGWPRRDHQAQRVEVRFIERLGCHVDIRCTWFELAPRGAGQTEQQLEASVTIPLDPDDLLELAMALMRYVGLDGDMDDGELRCASEEVRTTDRK